MIKLNSTQMNYTVREKEFLGIVEGFKVFEIILQEVKVKVHTDYLNLLYKNLPTQRMAQYGDYSLKNVTLSSNTSQALKMLLLTF